MQYNIGLDLGKRRDHAALAVIERIDHHSAYTGSTMNSLNVVLLERSEALAAAGQDARLRENIDLCRQNLDILPFHRASAEAYGALFEAVAPKKRRILDRMVAAQALEAGLTLVTLTPEIFEDIRGLTVVSWA